MSEGSVKVYQRALSSWLTFSRACNATPFPISEAGISNWISYMGFSGISAKTVTLYLNALSGMNAKATDAGITEHTGAFQSARKLWREMEETAWDNQITPEQFGRFALLAKKASSTDADSCTAFDLMLLSLIRGCTPVAETATLKKSETAAMDAEEQAIANRNASTGRRYVFGLHQSELTANQLSRHIDSELREWLTSRNLPFFTSADLTVKSYWAYAAMKAGRTGSDVRAAAECVPPGVPALALCRPSENIDASEINAEVRRLLLVNPLKWYAMRLRPRVKFRQLSERFGKMETEKAAVPEIFYPCDEIVRRTDGRLTAEDRPVISDIVFFRSRVTDIFPLFCEIGDLAWCYRTPGSINNQYAAIPDSAFRQFQRTIGHFTPDYEVAPIGKLAMGPDDRVVILGGAFEGMNADILSVIKGASEENIVFRLHFVGANGIDCRVKVDSRMVRKVTEA